MEYIGPAAARQHVITDVAHQYFGRRRADCGHGRIGVAERPAEYHVAHAGIASVWAGVNGADDQIVEAIAVHVARRADGPAGMVARNARQCETIGAIQRIQIETGREARACRTPHNSCRRSRWRTGHRRSDRHNRHRSRRPPTRQTSRSDSSSGTPLSLETIRTVQRGEVEIGRKARSPAKHHVTCRGVRAADDQVVEPVTVHVARRRNRPGQLGY